MGCFYSEGMLGDFSVINRLTVLNTPSSTLQYVTLPDCTPYSNLAYLNLVNIFYNNQCC